MTTTSYDDVAVEQTHRLNKEKNTGLLFSIILCTSIFPTPFLWAPAISAALAGTMHLSFSQIGFMFSVMMFASSCSSLPAFFWMKMKNWHHIALFFMSVFVIGGLLSAWLLQRHFALFLVVQAVTAFSAGSLLILCTRSVARLSNRSRAFGWVFFGQLILGTVGLAVLPTAFSYVGPGAAFAIPAILMFVCLPLYRNFAGGENIRPEGDAASDPARGVGRFKVKFTRYGACGALSIFLLYVCLSGIWTFVNVLQAPAGMSDSMLNTLLTVGSAAGIVGAGAAALLGRDKLRGPVLVLGFAALVVSLLAMAIVPNMAGAYVAVILFKLTWTLVVPFMLTVITLHDDTGDLINVGNFLLGIGMAVGPALCGYILQAFGYQSMFVFGAVMAFLAMAAIVVSHFKAPARSVSHA